MGGGSEAVATEEAGHQASGVRKDPGNTTQHITVYGGGWGVCKSYRLNVTGGLFFFVTNTITGRGFSPLPTVSRTRSLTPRSLAPGPLPARPQAFLGGSFSLMISSSEGCRRMSVGGGNRRVCHLIPGPWIAEDTSPPSQSLGCIRSAAFHPRLGPNPFPSHPSPGKPSSPSQTDPIY